MGIIVDQKKCVGCRICELVCSFNHIRAFCPEQSKIQIFLTDDGNVEINLFCSGKCSGEEEALCVQLCPTQAIQYKTK